MTRYVGDEARPVGSKCGGLCRSPKENTSQSHCSVCHVTFKTVTDFDAHRRGGYCLDPESVGLIEVDDLWATPEGHAQRERSVATLATARAKRRSELGK